MAVRPEGGGQSGFFCAIKDQILRVDGFGLGQLVVSFTHDQNFIAIERRFEEGIDRPQEIALSNGPRYTVAIFLFGLAECQVLNGLDRAEYVRAALRLNRHDVLRTSTIKTDI